MRKKRKKEKIERKKKLSPPLSIPRSATVGSSIQMRSGAARPEPRILHVTNVQVSPVSEFF